MKFIISTLLAAAFALAACQGAAVTNGAGEIREVSVAATSAAVGGGGVQFVDVRTIEEYRSGHAPKAVNMPLDAFEKESAALDRSRPVYVICQTGRRSQKAAEILKKAGFGEIYNVTGGTSAWTAAGLPLEK